MSELDFILEVYTDGFMISAEAEKSKKLARAELAQLSATIAAQAQRIAELEATIALNQYVTPPFELTDDDTVRLALRCAELEQAVEEARELVTYACETWPNRDDDYFRPDHEEAMDALKAWHAAHPAPAQTAAPVTCQCCCGCENIATKEDEHGMHVCEGCYNDYYGIAAGRDEVDDLAESELSNDELDEANISEPNHH